MEGRYEVDYLLLVTFLYILVILLIICDEEIIENDVEKHDKMPKIIAHRGAAGYAPENTFAAFDKAIELKADYIELDVQMSHDGELIVSHDAYNSHQHEQIPTLNDVLNHYHHKIGLLIELKNPEHYPGIEKKLAQLLKNKKLDRKKNDAIIVQSFNQQAIKRFSKLAPTIPTGLLLNFHPSELTNEKLKEFSSFVNYLNPPAFWIDHQLVQKIHHAGMKVFCWTVNDKQLFTQIKKMNVDGIITDFPDLPKQLTHSSSIKEFDFNQQADIAGLFTSFIYFANTILKELQT